MATQGEALTAQQIPGGGGNGQAQAPGRRLGARAITGLTGVGLLLVFMIQNTEDVKLDFLFWSFTWPLWLYTFVIALVGAVVWVGWGVFRRHRRRKERRQERRY
jgi:uncharacterized integral membrane protein